MKIYTKTGDRGETALFGGQRVAKDDLRVEAYGSVDELNSVLGAAAVAIGDGGARAMVMWVQHRLFDLGAQLATPAASDPKLTAHVPKTTAAAVQRLETWIDDLDGKLLPLRTFILPGGSEAAARLHVARCVCRRAERRVTALARTAPVNEEILRFLNRLSDYLFVLARWVNQEAGVPDPTWEPGDAT
ncbi:MAG: cob(I)yrinic acid a,c-diamide adenosyltransferase [Armatimonadetes bacterium]|nr:cob(I)yrinic acid a,c-diamide adenosyltransferase [Armatimonadota bacterium]